MEKIDSINRKENWINQQKRDRSVAYKIVERKSNDVSKDTSELIKYLDMQTKFEMYSPANCLLLLAQLPNATYCREAQNWKKDNYKVNMRDKSALILEPSKPQLMEDGSTKTFYNPKWVYDISSTDAPNLVKPEPPNQADLLRALLKTNIMKVEVVDDLGIDNKFASYDEKKGTLSICRGKNIVSTIQDIVYEMSKYLQENNLQETKDEKSFMASCVTYMFCKKYGIYFPEESLSKIENQLSGTDKEIRNKLTQIKDTYISIIERTNVNLEKENKKEIEKSKEQVR